MSPKQRQNNARRSKRSENAYNVLADLPHDGSTPTFDGRDGKVDEVDGNSAGEPLQNVVLAGSPVPSASTDQLQDTTTRSLYIWRHEMIKFILEEYGARDEACLDRSLAANHSRISALTLLGVNQDNRQTHRRFDTVEEKMCDISDHINDRLDAVLAKLNDLHGENAKLRAAYDSTQGETAALKAAVAALTKKIDEQQQVISAPPSLNLTASSSAMEEMTMQLSVVQHDIQDVLDAVRNPPGKRKRRGSDQNTEPTSPTNRRPVNHKPRTASPVQSLMHSKSEHHTATATPPPAFSTTSTETPGFLIGFVFAALCYVIL
ncbi:hypothetical protein BZA77DRAFT_361810 [Pyronema omphalodes]|nr:hypothetical protein BZA77DRAFT_361810 [Pyronema omphalodes]